MKKYIQKYQWMVLLGILFLGIETMADIIQPAVISRLIDSGVLEKDMNQIVYTGSLLLSISFLGAVFAVGRTIMAAKVSTAFAADLRYDLYQKVQKMSIEEVEQLSKASLMTRLTADVNQIQNLVNGMMRIFLKAPIVFIGSLTMVSFLNIKLAMIVYLSLPLVILVMLVNTKFSFVFYQRMQKSIDRLNQKAGEFLSGIRIIRSFNSEKQEIELFQEVNEGLYASAIGAMRISSLFNPTVHLILNIALTLILYYSGHLRARGEILPGQIIAFINYMAQVLFSINIIGAVFSNLVRARASYERLTEILRRPISKGRSGGVEISEIQEVIFDRVSFAYPNRRNVLVLKDISFSAKKGETIGMIGGIGSGKSSLIHLLSMLYEVSQGQIRINGRDILSLDQESLREKIGVVPQDPMLFIGSVKDNLCWGIRDIDEQAAEEALQAAMAYDFVCEMQEGMQSMIGRGGTNLSGGQKQRLTLARALLRHPQLLLLDDVMSKVDVQTEIRIRQALSAGEKERITFLVSQKIWSIMKCDRILVFKDGRIVGCGSHEELMRENREYIEIYQSQIGGDFDER